MALKLAGEECGAVQGLDNLGWLRTVRASDSAPGLSVRQDGAGRVVEFKDGATEVLHIPDGGEVTLGRDLEFQNNLALFNGLLGLGVPSGLFDADYLTLRHQTDSRRTALGIYPRGSPLDYGGILEVGMNDRVTDNPNYSLLSIYASRAGQKYIIDSQKGGSSSLYPLEIRMNNQTLVVFGTDNTIDFNSRSLKNLVAGTDVNLGAYKLNMAQVLLKQYTASGVAVRDTADTAFRDFYADKLFASTYLQIQAALGYLYAGNGADNAYVSVQIRKTGVGWVEAARFQGQAEPRLKFTLPAQMYRDAGDYGGNLPVILRQQVLRGT